MPKMSAFSLKFGSNGNCIYIETSDFACIIDAGIKPGRARCICPNQQYVAGRPSNCPSVAAGGHTSLFDQVRTTMSSSRQVDNGDVDVDGSGCAGASVRTADAGGK